jgi:hypothetical protein
MRYVSSLPLGFMPFSPRFALHCCKMLHSRRLGCNITPDGLHKSSIDIKIK